MNNIKGILFDFGGTIDTNGIHWCEMIWMAYELNKIEVNKLIYEESYLYAERNLNTMEINEATTFYQLLFQKISLQMQFLYTEKKIKGIQPVDIVTKLLVDSCYSQVKSNIKKHRDVLIYLKSKYTLGLVSNFYGNLKTVVKEFGLQDIFTETLDSQVIGIRKPDPLIWATALKLLKLQANETVVIGDSYNNDIIPAKYLECKTIWINGKSWYDQSLDEHSSADHTIFSLDELHKIL